MKKSEILWVSLYAPYDSIGHAGGKIENYYIKKLKNSNLSNIFLISFYKKSQKSLIDLDNYGIRKKLICTDRWYKPLIDIESTLNPYNYYANSLQNFYILHLKKSLKKYKQRRGIPAIVILQWTQTVLLSDYIKHLFGNIPIIAIEEDVQFLSYERHLNKANNIFEKNFWSIRYKRLKKLEIDRLNIVTKICVNNIKDKILLQENGIDSEKIFTWIPWFDNYQIIDNLSQNKDILFYGSMNRPENYLSAIWFIENVFKKIEHTGYRFIIVGNNPNKKLLKYRSSTVLITGFVDDISKYFEKSMCLVAPLVLGAGIKIKILEAMSAGIPVLTNDIGIEGISAKDRIHYYHCQTPSDYIDSIKELSCQKDLRKKLGTNAKLFIQQNYNLETSYNYFQNIILQMLEK